MTNERLIEIVRLLELRLVNDECNLVIATKFLMDGTIEREYTDREFIIETRYGKPDVLALFKELAEAGLVTDYTPNAPTVSEAQKGGDAV